MELSTLYLEACRHTRALKKLCNQSKPLDSNNNSELSSIHKKRVYAKIKAERFEKEIKNILISNGLSAELLIQLKQSTLDKLAEKQNILLFKFIEIDTEQSPEMELAA